VPLRTTKKETDQSLSLEWALHVKNYQLNLDKNKCVGCQICTLACPKEAVKTTKPTKTQQQKTQKATVDIDLAKCNFCGICDATCPYGAIKLTIDGKHILSVIEKQSFPTLIRDIQADPSRFPTNHKEAEDACPLSLIKITYSTPDGKPTEDPTSLTEPDRSWYKTNINIDKDHCPCCTACKTKLPDGAIHVHKFITGKLEINPTKCPDQCTLCLDTCPITGTLYLSHQDNKIHVNEASCIYCGACKLACPIDEALELKRTSINHTPIRSGTWNKALERLTSPTDLTKELKTKGSQKAREAVRKRTMPEDQKNA